jgi:hypothetical protein
LQRVDLSHISLVALKLLTLALLFNDNAITSRVMGDLAAAQTSSS